MTKLKYTEQGFCYYTILNFIEFFFWTLVTHYKTFLHRSTDWIMKGVNLILFWQNFGWFCSFQFISNNNFLCYLESISTLSQMSFVKLSSCKFIRLMKQSKRALKSATLRTAITSLTDNACRISIKSFYTVIIHYNDQLDKWCCTI